MKNLLQILILTAAMTFSLLACSSTEDLDGSGGFSYIDYDPAKYFKEHSEKSKRAAVITFNSVTGGIASFDAFVTDEVIRKLSSISNLTLVERSRIDLILQEHALTQSGVVSGDEAVKLGKLLSVDYLVIGKYNYEEKTIFVRGRILDSVTGNMEKAFGFKIPFAVSKKKVPADDKVEPDKGCEGIQRPVLLALQDLSTPEAVENAVDRAIEVPWKKPCGRIHMKVTSEFAFSNLYPERYHIFLARTLESMERPRDEYYTIREIFSYFARDKNISEFEWAAAREVLKRGWHPFHLKYFFNTHNYNMIVMQRRATELLELARKKEIGRPYAISEYIVGKTLLTRPFLRNTEKGIAFSLFILRSIHNPAGAPSKEAKLFFNVITGCYEETLTPDYRLEAMELLTTFLKSRQPDKDYADYLWHFLNKIDEKIREQKKINKYIPHLPYNPNDLRKLNADFKEYLCIRKQTGVGSYSEKEIEAYFKKYGVKCAQ